MLVNCNVINKHSYPNFKESQMKNLVGKVVLLKDFHSFVYVTYCFPDGTGCKGYLFTKEEIEKNNRMWEDEAERTEKREVVILDDEVLI